MRLVQSDLFHFMERTLLVIAYLNGFFNSTCRMLEKKGLLVLRDHNINKSCSTQGIVYTKIYNIPT